MLNSKHWQPPLWSGYKPVAQREHSVGSRQKTSASRVSSWNVSLAKEHAAPSERVALVGLTNEQPPDDGSGSKAAETTVAGSAVRTGAILLASVGFIAVVVVTAFAISERITAQSTPPPSSNAPSL